MKARVVSSPWSSFGKLASTLLFAASCELLAAEADHSSQPGITNPPAASATNSQQGTVAVATRPKPSADLAPELQVAEGLLLAIPKSAFGKDYLFSASLIPQAPAGWPCARRRDRCVIAGCRNCAECCPELIRGGVFP